MKKIIMGIAVAALATSMFAADVSAKVKLTGELVNFNGKDLTALKLNNHQSHDWEPDMALSVSTDNAGATIKFKTMDEWNSGNGETSSAWNIWFKVFDLVKVTVGCLDVNLNQETIDWSNTKSSWAKGGYALEAGIAGVDIGAYILGDWNNPWLNANGVDGKLRVGDTVIKAGYSMPFGTINGFFEYNGQNKVTKNVKTGEVKYAFDEATGTVKASMVEKKVDWYDYNYMRFGLGYKSGNFVDGLNFFVNVIGGINTKATDVKSAEYSGKFSNLTPEVFGDFSMGAFNAKLFVQAPLSFIDGEQKDQFGFHLFTTLKLQYALDMGITPYVYMKAADWTNIACNGILVRPGVTGKVGIMEWEIQVEMDIAHTKANGADKPDTPAFTIKVPVLLTVNF